MLYSPKTHLWLLCGICSGIWTLAPIHAQIRDPIKKPLPRITVEQSRPNPNTCANLNIAPNQNFRRGQSWGTCGYSFRFQGDSNLVWYGPSGSALWSSATQNSGADRLSIQTDGNIVLYAGNSPIWSSGTQGNPGAYLTLQTDGNVVIYSRSGQPLWSTGTQNRR